MNIDILSDVREKYNKKKSNIVLEIEYCIKRSFRSY